MRTYPILPLLLAAVVSAAPSNLPAELKYDRLSVDYARGGDDRAYGVNGRALLGGCFLLGGGVSENRFKSLGTTAGRGTDLALGYVFALPKGDLIASAGYGQVQANGLAGTRTLALQAEASTYGLAWRQRLGESYELSLGYAYTADRQTLRSTVGTTVTTTTVKDHDGAVNLGLRYNVDAHVDVTLGYGLFSGSNVWSVSTGYNF